MKKRIDLGAIPDKELYGEVARRRSAARAVHAGGRKPSCVCGKCKTCKKRMQMREYRKGKTA